MAVRKRATWDEIKRASGRDKDDPFDEVYRDEARIAAFQGLVYRLRKEAGLTQAELAARMGTTQSSIARMEGGGTRPTFDTLERLAKAVGVDLVIGLGVDLGTNESIAQLERDGHAFVRRAV
jgi:ribosome-binding protein aMBF1 (putative translation factor)